MRSGRITNNIEPMTAPDPMEKLDLFDAGLDGFNLIEASAGTGKTFTITGLYLRLVLEGERQVDSILVVTFTNAATAELHGRIRSRLVEALQAFEAGAGNDDLCRRLLARCPDRAQALRRLRRAVLDFDQAAVFTIHGFCQRVLSDSAFESGMPFETALAPEEDDLLQEIADDFWRRQVQDVSPALADFLLERHITPGRLLAAVRGGVGRPCLEVRGGTPPRDLELREAEFRDAFDQARELWLEAGDEVRERLRTATGLNGNKYRKSSLENWFREMDACLGPRPGPWFRDFTKFTTGVLSASVKKGGTPPRHPFFDACEALAAARENLEAACGQALAGLKTSLLAYCNRELRARKAKERVQSYDDLLLNLDQALSGENGPALAEAIRRRYSAVLIDEFQDTDPTQYRIFSRIYRDSGLPVFLVGDPKQAIYSFRGADIFAYRQAREDAGNQYTLDLNWRSDPRLVAAVNALFDQPHESFFHHWIPFHRAGAADRERDGLCDPGSAGAPFRIWFMAGGAKPLAKADAEQAATRATAAEIVRLLNQGRQGRVSIGGRKLSGGDIAVLVRSHRQGRLVGERLRALGVHSVQQSRQDVFQSHEAEELERVLRAVAEPGGKSRVMAALATDMLGISGNAMEALCRDEQALEAHLEFFHEHHRRWREQGFVRMFHHLLSDSGVAMRLLGFADGERRMTNLLHLEELLHKYDSSGRPGMEGLLKWFSQRRQGGAPGGEETELRLESDENLVHIVTIHKSKGLQYPVVFCPFLWDGRLYAEKAGSFSFHDPAEACRPVLELGSDRMEEGRVLAMEEEFAEGLRLLYVALTRAQHRCYLAWGNVSGAGKSALAWLLHPAGSVARTGESFKRLGDEALRSRLDELAEKAAGGILVEPLPRGETGPLQGRADEAVTGAARQLGRPLGPVSRVTSFTALVSGHGAEPPDYDARQMTPAAGRRGHDIFGFPRGARAGRCLHAIFERLDFTCLRRAGLEALAGDILRAHGFDLNWAPVVADMVERVLATPLDEAGSLRLQSVSPARRLVELEFHYPLASMKAEELRSLLLEQGFAEEGPIRQAIERMAFAGVSGFMKGYIDLVFQADGRFYLADYKSNWLGDEIGAYAGERLSQVIAREDYYLQYLFYTLALHRHLGLRLPGYDYEQHFGGVFYLFLRGMDPGAGSGVYRDRPSLALINALDEYVSERAGG